MKTKKTHQMSNQGAHGNLCLVETAKAFLKIYSVVLFLDGTLMVEAKIIRVAYIVKHQWFTPQFLPRLTNKKEELV